MAGPVRWAKTNWMGLALCLAIAAASWLAAVQVGALKVLGPAILSIFIGMLAGTAIKLPERLSSGIGFAAKKLLQLSVILLGFEMNLGRALETGGRSLAVMAVTLAAAALAAYIGGRLLRIERNTNVLIGVGTAICGGSAIAATAPVIGAGDREISHAVSTIFLFNIVAVFAFPVLGRAMGLSEQGFGIWAGTAINDTSSVVAAAAAYGETALSTATVVKLTRTLMIIPVALLLSVLTARRAGAAGSSLRLARAFPWFVLGFVAASALCTLIPAAAPAYRQFGQAGKFCIAVAMAAIGLKTNLVALIRSGPRPILLGLICWLSVAASSLAIQCAMGSLH